MEEALALILGGVDIGEGGGDTPRWRLVRREVKNATEHKTSDLSTTWKARDVEDNNRLGALSFYAYRQKS
jgi:hypothetical protein